jgi:alpha-1,3-rhamnosyl/mannosyltransferase
MRVALETNVLYVTQAGIARYTRGLLKGLRQLALPELDLHEVAWPVENLSYRQPARMLKTFYREFIWSKLIAPGRIRRLGAELFHAPSVTMVIPPRPVRRVTTLHDLASLRHPERFRWWHRRSARRGFENARLADRLICISRFSADEAMTLLGLPASRIEVIYNGCDFHEEEGPVAEQAPGFAVPAEFFLFVGSLEPGKNLALLKAVYQLATAKGVALPPLLIMGARWAGVSTEGPPPSGWHYLGRQPDDVLVYLYRRALALVFPTKYEGFGLPLAEAMAVGCPTICSPVASLPEIGGDAAMFVEMTPEAYLKAMRAVAGDAALRQRMIQAGRQRARQFTWKRCAAAVVAVYRDVLG